MPAPGQRVPVEIMKETIVDKKRVAVIMGGKSSEHEVSLVSAATVVENIDKDLYDVILIGITKEGIWKEIESMESVKDGSWLNKGRQVLLVHDTGSKELLFREGNRVEPVHVDVMFPVLHGLNGEDGTIQGMFEMAGIPYVGCGVIASSCSMDKFYTKIIADSVNVRQAGYVGLRRRDLKNMDDAVRRVEAQLDYPVFVKPSNAGSSQGVSRADDREQLEKALRLAAEHDSKILVEETIIGRELECAVLGGHGETKASGVGEILAADEFYSYDAKYNNEESKTVVNPDLPEGTEEEIRRYAVDIFNALDGYGLSRVDFFLTDEGNEVVFNEINTIPGFTSISMYPMLWEEQGIDKKTLVQKLIDLAFKRYDD